MPLGDRARDRLFVVVARTAAVIILLLGLALTIGMRWRMENADEERQRLRTQGVELMAAVVDIDYGTGKAAPEVLLSYEFNGQQHRASTLCGGGGCPGIGAEVKVWVDAERPEHLVTEYGQTEDTRFSRMRRGGLGLGVFLIVLGVAFWIMTGIGAQIGRAQRLRRLAQEPSVRAARVAAQRARRASGSRNQRRK